MQITWNQIWHLFHSLPYIQFSSVQFSLSVMYDSLWPYGMQHTRPPCPLPTPGIYPNSCPLSWWCYPTISSSVIPFSSHPKSFPAPGSFQMSQLFASDGQSIRVLFFFFFSSFSFNINPSNEHSGLISFRIDWLDLVAIQGTLKSLLQHHSSKASIFQCSAFFIVQLSHPYMTTRKTIALTEYRVLLVCVCVYTCTCALTVSDFFCNLMDCNPPGSSVHGICQGRTLGWVAISSSRGSFQPRDLINYATWEAHSMLLEAHN